MRVVVAILFMLALSFAPFAIKPNVEVVQNEVDSTTLRHRVRIVAAGDLMMHTPQLSAARQQNGEYDFSKTFEFVTPYFQDADIAIVNLETTLAERPPYAGYPCFRSPKAVAGAMRDAGIDVVALANNHCCDGGTSGIRTTIKTLDSLGFKRLGVYADSVDYNRNNILYLKQNNISFAILNYTYGTNGLPVPRGMIVNRIDTVAMASDFAAVKRRGVDCMVAVVHWGNEYERKPNREQQRLADFMRHHGVDIILGGHPHVVQRVEADSVDGVTLWSMGNFVSNQSKRYCNGGLMGVIDVERVGDGPLRYKLNVVPVWVKRPEYKIIPQPIGDTMQMGAYYRQIYELFMADTKSLLSI